MSNPTRILPRESVQEYRRWTPDALARDSGRGRSSLGGAAGAARSAVDPAVDTAAPPAQWPTAAELEALRESARQEGYREGLAQAKAQAETMGAIVAALRENVARVETDVADKMLGLAIDIAREVVRGTLAITPDALMPVIHEALAVLPQTLHHVTLHMHPDDATVVNAYLQDHPLVHPVRVRANQAITRGGCRITANEADLDATVETRWQRVIAKLGSSEAWDPDAGGTPPASTGGDD